MIDKKLLNKLIIKIIDKSCLEYGDNIHFTNCIKLYLINDLNMSDDNAHEISLKLSELYCKLVM